MATPTEHIVAHTPGPWHVGELLLIGQHLIRDDVGDIVAEASSEGWKQTPATAAANARLIAAAPELLAALKEVLAHLRSITLDPGDDEDDAPALVAAEALVAKAEGRS